MDPSKASDLIPATGRVLIAFSGGGDSVCLAHWLTQTLDPERLVCIHIDHGLDSESAHRAAHAEKIAAALGLPCQVETLGLQITRNVEARAREARYTALQGHMRHGDVLVTAHHADDVAETMLLRLLRGGSTLALSGIQQDQAFGPGRLIRPLLAWSKTMITDHLTQHALMHLQDPTNDVLSLDRNFIRSAIMPRLVDRFPGAVAALNQSAQLNADAAKTLTTYLRQDLQSNMRSPYRLSTQGWAELSAFHQGELIRQWCRDHALSPPPGKPLRSFIDQLKTADPDRCPTLHWQHASLYHYQNQLWLEPGSSKHRQALHDYALTWTGAQPLPLPRPLGQLTLSPEARQRLIKAHGSALLLRVCSGQPGETIALGASPQVRRIRSLMSKAHIPPWRRDRWPRVWLDDELIACGDRWQTQRLESGLTWSGTDPSWA